MIKILFDRIAAAVGLVALSPLMLVLMIVIRFRMGAPVIFRQTRIGLNERPFEFLKFRTMTNATDAGGSLLPDDRRLTPLGRLLRATSLDELPQLWNVLRGEMSLVGPRPLPIHYLRRYNAYQRRRHLARPGITGWAQVNGRNRIGWAERLGLDVWYVENQSLHLDNKILWMTLLKVLAREDINQPGHATMAEFLGDREPDE